MWNRPSSADIAGGMPAASASTALEDGRAGGTCSHNRRTSRWASTPRRPATTRYGSTPISTSRRGVEAESLVCSEASTRCPVSDASTAMIAVSLVADLADQHDVGVGAEQRPQRDAEREPGAGVDLHLLDALEVVFDRVLDRQDVHGRLVELAQRAVEGGGLARAGRPGHEHDPPRPGKDGVEPFELRRLHPEVFEPGQVVVATEQADHGSLAADRRHGRDAEVDAAPAARTSTPRPSWGTRFSAMSMEAITLMRLMMPAWRFLRRVHHLVEHAVDAVSHAEPGRPSARCGCPTLAPAPHG